MLEKENCMFEQFLKRLDPKDFQLKGLPQHSTPLLLYCYSSLFCLVFTGYTFCVVCVCVCAAIPTAHSSQLDLQKRRVRIKEGASSHRYTLSHTQSPDNTKH